MSAYEAVQRIEELERKLAKAEHDRDRYKRYIKAEVSHFRTIKRMNDLRSSLLAASLFAVIKNSSVAPKGIELGKTPEEIDDMAYETMLEVTNMIDFAAIDTVLRAAADRYAVKKIVDELIFEFKFSDADGGIS